MKTITLNIRIGLNYGGIEKTEGKPVFFTLAGERRLGAAIKRKNEKGSTLFDYDTGRKVFCFAGPATEANVARQIAAWLAPLNVTEQDGLGVLKGTATINLPLMPGEPAAIAKAVKTPGVDKLAAVKKHVEERIAMHARLKAEATEAGAKINEAFHAGAATAYKTISEKLS